MKKIIGLLLVCILSLTGCGKEEVNKVDDYEPPKEVIKSEEKQLGDTTYYETNLRTDKVVLNIQNDKKILIELYPDVAPITVANFQKLVDSDFYNDVIFHRVIKDFMIQTGDATSLGREAEEIKGEFSSNGVKNDLKHDRGVVSMARTNVKDSASSQFFIVHKDSPHLDGEYAAFGRVIEGLDVVDSIAKSVTDNNDKPIKDIKIESVEFIEVVGKNE